MAGGTRSFEMARRMVAAGHQVNMITSRIDGQVDSSSWVKERIDGIDVHWLPVSYDNSMGYYRRLVSFTRFARSAGMYAAGLDTDVVFATSTPLTIAIPAVKVSRRRKVPMVFEVRDLWPEVPIAMGALNFPFAKMMALRLEKWAYANAAQIVGLSPAMCEGIARTGYPQKHIHCIPNSSDIALFDVPESRGAQFRADRPWLGDRPLVIYAGTFGKVNGVDYLASLAAEMKVLAPDIRFLAVGRGGEFKRVRQKAVELGVLDENFFMENALSKLEMPALFSAATVTTSLVIPLEQLWKNSANKLFDSFAAGRPIAINHGGWQADLLDETGAGIVLDKDDTPRAARRLLAFIRDGAGISRARKEAAMLARERFSRDKLAADLIRVLERAVRTPGPPGLSDHDEDNTNADAGKRQTP